MPKHSLTDTFLRSLKTSQAVKKYADGGGLYLHVAPTGGKLWRMAYRYEGKQKLLSFGAYPALSLKDARAKRDEAKALLASGIDPAAHKKAVKASVQAQTDNTFEIVAREWHDKFKGTWAASHADKLLARFDNDIFPHMGGEGIHTITAPALLEVIRKIEARGALETAHRALQTCGQVFRLCHSHRPRRS